MPIIEVNNLTKEYKLGHLSNIKETAINIFKRLTFQKIKVKERFKALDDVSFSVDEGEVVGIIGHNGAGKSTLLKHLANISKPTKGTVKVTGSVAPLIEVGAGINPELTGRENIFLNGAIFGIPRKVIRNMLDDIIDFSELEEFIDTPVKRYSSGMKVKLAFSIATTMDADILIVDEVLAVGDLMFQQKCIERMEQMIFSKGKTVLIVGHNIRQLERLCSRVILLDHGKVSLDGKASDVCKVFFHEAQDRAFDRNKTITHAFLPKKDAGVIQVTDIKMVDKQGGRAEDVKMHEDLNFIIQFESNLKLSNPEIIIGLHTSDFVQVLSVSSATLNARPDIEIGSNQLKCCFDDIPLRPSYYSLRLSFLDQNRQLLWKADHLISVRVVAGKYNINRMPEVGLLDLPAHWEFNKHLSHS